MESQSQQQMQQQAQQQAQKQSQKRSAQSLRETRNTLIQKYAQTGVSVKALAYMFSLSEQTIRTALQGITAVQAKQFSIEQLESARENIKKTLSQQGYTAGEIEYILGKGSLAQAETIRNLQEKIKYYKGLEFQYHTDIESLKQEKAKLNTDWQKKYEEQVLSTRTLLIGNESKVAELETEKEDLEQKLKAAKKENEGLSNRLKKEMATALNLGDKLLKAEKDNTFLEECQSRLEWENKELSNTIEDLTAEVENLKKEKQELSKQVAALTEAKGSLEQEKAKLGADWKKKYNDKLEELRPAYEKMNEANRGLLSANSELQKEKEDLLSQLRGLKQQLLEREKETAGIEAEFMKAVAENKNLTAEIEGLRQQETESCIKTRYTNSDIERMIEVYKQSRKNKSKTLEILHSEGIMISYRHLIRILQKRGFKSTKSRG